MKPIGLLGGLSWESTALYYRIINREVAARRGGLRSADLRLHSFDFEQVVAHQKAGAWHQLAAMLGHAARALENAGAQCLLIGSNTMHRVADEVQAAVSIPLLHIADATSAAIGDAGVRHVALLGTRYTMEQRFYVEHLERAGIACIVPDEVNAGALAGRPVVFAASFDAPDPQPAVSPAMRAETIAIEGRAYGIRSRERLKAKFINAAGGPNRPRAK